VLSILSIDGCWHSSPPSGMPVILHFSMPFTVCWLIKSMMLSIDMLCGILDLRLYILLNIFVAVCFILILYSMGFNNVRLNLASFMVCFAKL